MRLGIDFDNTITCYDGVFHAAALERGLISPSLDTHKNAVRDYLNGSGRKDDFTLLQGYVYGARMDLAAPFHGVEAFLHSAQEWGWDVFIVSHKTKTPLLGPSYDMHEAAREFLRRHSLVGDRLIRESSVFFETSKDSKLRRIQDLRLDAFIDDLPEILKSESFPASTRPLLFDPNDEHGHEDLDRFHDWGSITRHLAP